MLVRKKSSFPLRSDQYSTYGRVCAMREGIGGENWTVVGQTNAREGGREGGKNWIVRPVLTVDENDDENIFVVVYPVRTDKLTFLTNHNENVSVIINFQPQCESLWLEIQNQRKHQFLAIGLLLVQILLRNNNIN